MSDPYPISCISCRRKKIKCNKYKPCNQCKRRNIVCKFPSTFRNIEITKDENEFYMESDLLQNDNDENYMKVVQKLKHDYNELLSQNYQLNEKNKVLKVRINQYNVEKNHQSPHQQYHQLHDQQMKAQREMKRQDEVGEDQDESESSEPFKISGETSEFGEKFYGPQSSSFMIETLKNNTAFGSGNYPQNHLDKDRNPQLEDSYVKKSLPILKPGISKSDNMQLIYTLVDSFFAGFASNFYRTFISKVTVLEFLDEFDSIESTSWENDDDLLLLLMILILAIIRLTPMEFMKIFDIATPRYSKFVSQLHQALFHNFEKLRHNLINESMLTIQAYILCTEYYFIEQKYEECWSMMFHTCSIAYSVGLHVTGKLKSNQLKIINNSILGEGSNDEYEDITKLKVWFSLRILSDKVCSILGRPNPISIQVNSLVLKYNNNYNNINLSGKNTSILLKIGLSECIRLSNMMLIENFMIDFKMMDLLNLNTKFEKEIEFLENYLEDLESNDNFKRIPIPNDNNTIKENSNSSVSMYSSENPSSNSTNTAFLSHPSRTDSQSRSSSSMIGDNTEPEPEPEPESSVEHGSDDDSKDLSYDEYSHLPLKIEKINILNDLIIFYINKAKLFEPFIIKFKEENDSILILKNLSNSIINFLQYIFKFLSLFEIRLMEKDLNYVKIGKYFRVNFPFLNSFIYQGIIIIFTLLNYKFKHFINLTFKDKFDSVGFLKELQIQLNKLIAIDSHFNEKVWSINILYLANKNLEIIDVIQTQQGLMANQLQAQQGTNSNNHSQNQESDMFQFQNDIYSDSYYLNNTANNLESNFIQNSFKSSLDMGMQNPQSVNSQNMNQMNQMNSGNTGQMNSQMNSQMHSSGQGMNSSMNQGINSNSSVQNASITVQNPEMMGNLELDSLNNNLIPNELININLSDPFWITNPDNLPYYLSSPNEELEKQVEEELKNKKILREGSNKKPKYDI